MLNDLRLALRSLTRSPTFAIVAVLTLALGIGASTAIFSVVNGILLRSLPYSNPGSLMQVQTVTSSGFTIRVSYPDFEDLREQNQSFEELAAYADWTTSASAAGQGSRVHWAQVSPGFFSVFGMEPTAGRVFGDDEEQNGQQVAVVSHRYWQSRLGSITNLSDQSIRVGEDVYSVIGVMPSVYDFPVGAEVWVPREQIPESRTAHNWSVVGNLREGISESQAQQDLTRIARSIRQQHGDDTDTVDAAVRPVLEQLVGSVRPALLVLLGATAILMSVACVNVANLLLTRAFSRDRESAVRLALGAGRTRVARAYLAESLVLSLLGGALGVLIALIGVPAIMALEPGLLPRVQDVAIDWPVLAFALGTSVVLALIIGLVPAFRAARRDTREVLSGSRSIATGSPVTHRLRSGLVAAQIALTFVLLVGAGLLGRSVLELLAVDPGYRTDGALVMDVWLPHPDVRDRTPGGTRIANFLEELTSRLGALPGVERVGGINHFPLQGGGAGGTFAILQRPDEISSFADFDRIVGEPARSGYAEFRVASSDYFRALAIPLVEGRLFDERDDRDAPHAALISASLAEMRWPDEDPLGKLLFFGNMDGDFNPLTVVGTVGDVHDSGIGSTPVPTIYVDYRQRPNTAAEFQIAIQGTFDDGLTIASAGRISRELDVEVPVNLRTLEDLVSESLADRRFILFLVTLFGGLSLALASMGVYSVIAYLALQRTPEIGVRMALGAQGGHVIRMLLQQGVVTAFAGIAVGLAAAFALTRVLGTFLYGVGMTDPTTYSAATVAMLAAALGAAWIPAHRASRLAPVDALRHE